MTFFVRVPTKTDRPFFVGGVPFLGKVGPPVFTITGSTFSAPGATGVVWTTYNMPKV